MPAIGELYDVVHRKSVQNSLNTSIRMHLFMWLSIIESNVF